MEGDKLTRKQRIEYLASTISVLVAGFLIYSLLGSVEPINGSRLHSFFLFGLLGGVGFSAILSTVILSVRFISKKSLVFKIAASVLWPVTVGCCVYVGILSYLPYEIYNIVKIVKDKSM